MEKNLDQLRRAKKRMSEKIEILGQAENIEENNSNNTDGTNWSVFDNGAFNANLKIPTGDGKFLRGRTDGYFSEVSPDSFSELETFEKCKEDFEALKVPDRKSICLDIMGQGRIGYDLGADISIGWTYKKTKIESLPGRELEYGDLFNSKILKSHIDGLKKKIIDGGDLNEVFWRAVGGLGMYQDNTYALSYLYDNLFREVYKLANTGCKFYLSMRYGSEKDDSGGMIFLMRKLKKLGFDILDKEEEDRGGTYILTKTSDKQDLPSLRILSKQE